MPGPSLGPLSILVLATTHMPQSCFGFCNARSAFYSGLAPEQQAVWDEVRFLRKNGDAVAFQARQGSCFRVALRLLPPEAPPAAAVAATGEPKPEWRPVYDTTLRFEVQLV